MSHSEINNALEEKHTLTLNGIDFTYTVERTLAGGNESIDLFDANDEHVANAYVDHNIEQIIVDVFEQEDVGTLNYFEIGDSFEKVATHLANNLFC